ncbi:hypothetical protein V500_02041 [Pseudogymnoascus sp. VKM F-4518 (FW-2643)]|nr:hypothetical protein V500_02041 [Pseudogymnoascus sp. VKM F-4518 (FW-2643)]
MQLKTLFLLATVSLTAAAAATAPVTEGDLEIPAALVERSCSANGCTCAKGIKAGVYCGSCVVTIGGQTDWVIGRMWNDKHAYQCGSNGSCCDYGTASDCGTSKGRCASGKSITSPY